MKFIAVILVFITFHEIGNCINVNGSRSLLNDDLMRNQYRQPPPYNPYNPYGRPPQYNPYGYPNRGGNPYGNPWRRGNPYNYYGGGYGGRRGYGIWYTTTTVGFPWNLFGKK